RDSAAYEPSTILAHLAVASSHRFQEAEPHGTVTFVTPHLVLGRRNSPFDRRAYGPPGPAGTLRAPSVHCGISVGAHHLYIRARHNGSRACCGRVRTRPSGRTPGRALGDGSADRPRESPRLEAPSRRRISSGGPLRESVIAAAHRRRP